MGMGKKGRISKIKRPTVRGGRKEGENIKKISAYFGRLFDALPKRRTVLARVGSFDEFLRGKLKNEIRLGYILNEVEIDYNATPGEVCYLIRADGETIAQFVETQKY